jgi:hypothetical protein
MGVYGHAADGSDEGGRGLLLTIRVAADGTLYFHDLTADLLPVACALAPGNPALRARSEAAERFGQERNHEHDSGVEERGGAGEGGGAPCAQD